MVTKSEGLYEYVSLFYELETHLKNKDEPLKDSPVRFEDVKDHLRMLLILYYLSKSAARNCH